MPFLWPHSLHSRDGRVVSDSVCSCLRSLSLWVHHSPSRMVSLFWIEVLPMSPMWLQLLGSSCHLTSVSLVAGTVVSADAGFEWLDSESPQITVICPHISLPHCLLVFPGCCVIDRVLPLLGSFLPCCCPNACRIVSVFWMLGTAGAISADDKHCPRRIPNAYILVVPTGRLSVYHIREKSSFFYLMVISSVFPALYPPPLSFIC
jgi:hypothetical protein